MAAAKKKGSIKKPKSAPKRGAKAKGKGSSSKRGAFAVFLRSKQFAHLRGAFYIMFALFLLIAMAGYYATGCDLRANWLGTVGGAVASFFADNLFGIGSMGFSLLFFVYGMRLWDSVVLPWWKTLGSTAFWMLWLSVTLGYVGVLSDANAMYEHYAGIGLMLGAPLHALMSWWTLVLLVFVAVAFLVLVHKMELPEVHLPKVDLKKVTEDLKRVGSEDEGEKGSVKGTKGDGLTHVVDLNEQKRLDAHGYGRMQ